MQVKHLVVVQNEYMNSHGELLTLPGCSLLKLAVVDFSVLFWGPGFPYVHGPGWLLTWNSLCFIALTLPIIIPAKESRATNRVSRFLLADTLQLPPPPTAHLNLKEGGRKALLPCGVYNPD